MASLTYRNNYDVQASSRRCGLDSQCQRIARVDIGICARHQRQRDSGLSARSTKRRLQWRIRKGSGSVACRPRFPASLRTSFRSYGGNPGSRVYRKHGSSDLRRDRRPIWPSHRSATIHAIQGQYCRAVHTEQHQPWHRRPYLYVANALRNALVRSISAYGGDSCCMQAVPAAASRRTS